MHFIQWRLENLLKQKNETMVENPSLTHHNLKHLKQNELNHEQTYYHFSVNMRVV